jgi:hypothetical protein
MRRRFAVLMETVTSPECRRLQGDPADRRRAVGGALRPGGPGDARPKGAAEPGLGGEDSLLAAHRLQCSQPGPDPDEDRGRAGGKVHDPAASLSRAADEMGNRHEIGPAGGRSRKGNSYPTAHPETHPTSFQR